MEKKLHLERQFLRAKYPNAEIEVWSFDEHRLGLQPIMRRVWTSVGFPPIATVKQQDQWLWLYGFVHPESGENYWWLLPYVNTQLFNRVGSRFCSRISIKC